MLALTEAVSAWMPAIIWPISPVDCAGPLGQLCALRRRPRRSRGRFRRRAASMAALRASRLVWSAISPDGIDDGGDARGLLAEGIHQPGGLFDNRGDGPHLGHGLPDDRLPSRAISRVSWPPVGGGRSLPLGLVALHLRRDIGGELDHL